MPRVARVKNDEGIYHIMVRSVSDIPLFRNFADKDKYLLFIKKYQHIYRFKVYAYCLMTNHAHVALDCCGADISKIMKSINQCYSAYFNTKYSRHGHVFQDRFKSKLINNYKYLINLSAYIHNNPRDIKKYYNRTSAYKYSSLGIYMGNAQDSFGILDVNYILSFFSKDTFSAKKAYLDFVNIRNTSNDKLDIEFTDEGSQTSCERKILVRNLKPKDVIKFISSYTESTVNIHLKNSHKNTEIKALCVTIMRTLCNYSLKEICKFVGNITISGMWRLCEKGYHLIIENEKYSTIVDDIIERYSAA
ncbi:MAG TPA: transposase [Clostridiaceae bacterium]